MITHADVEAAAHRIVGRVRRTPVAEVDPDTFPPAGQVWLKLEFMQHTGSFKARGVFNHILAAAEAGELPSEGVIAASGGNAGLAVAHAAKTLNIPAEVYVPTTAPVVKLARLRALGATVVQHGDEYAEAYEAATKRAADSGALFCHAYDQPAICAGQGTLALELLDQVHSLDTVVLAVGGGGLMAGVAATLEGQAKVVAVEPETIPTLHTALDTGQPGPGHRTTSRHRGLRHRRRLAGRPPNRHHRLRRRNPHRGTKCAGHQRRHYHRPPTTLGPPPDRDRTRHRRRARRADLRCIPAGRR